MTEAEWLACDDPEPILGWPGLVASPRKLRLFAVACCRHIQDDFKDEDCLRAIDAAERYADGEATDSEMLALDDALFWGAAGVERAACYALNAGFDSGYQAEGLSIRVLYHVEAAICTAEVAAGGPSWSNPESPAIQAHQCHLVRDVVGNPFRPLTFAPAWRTPTVLGLALAAYDHRTPAWTLDPARLAVLSDALVEADCANETILAHLRSPGPHVRGCWAVDACLGRE